MSACFALSSARTSIRQAALALAGLCLAACGSPPSADKPKVDAENTTEQKASVLGSESTSEPGLFVDRSQESGLEFTHFNGMTGDFVYTEIFAGGVALFDYDNDGDLDVYAVQGRLLGRGNALEDALLPAPESSLIDRLFRNDLTPGDPTSLRFTDVTAEAGLTVDSYGMGVATGDFDNDGATDLYVTDAEGDNTLLRNRGDGTFEDVTETAGVADSRWSVAATFLDVDRDGLLDLYVSNYVEFSTSINKPCVNDVSMRDYCGPTAFRPAADILFKNLGNGRFQDATGTANILQPAAPSLGLVTGDWNQDGFIDLYIANDGYPNNLLLNRGDGSFVDEARISGAAMSGDGHAEAGMGISAGDFDRDGDEDLFLAHLDQETNTLYESQPGALFSDRTAMLGLGPSSFNFTGFGTGFLDIDNDGLLDLLVVNGAVQSQREQVASGDVHPLHQKNLAWRNVNGRFETVTAQAGSVFELSEVSRGAAFGDIDNDGDTDVVVHNNGGPLRLLSNRVGDQSSWIGVRAVGVSGRDMLGALVELSSPGPPQIRRIRSDGSYASASDPRALFGLGDATETATISITWPSGSQEIWTGLAPHIYHRLTKGSGQAAP